MSRDYDAYVNDYSNKVMAGLGKYFFSFMQIARCQIFHCEHGVESTSWLLNTQGGTVLIGGSLGKGWA